MHQSHDSKLRGTEWVAWRIFFVSRLDGNITLKQRVKIRGMDSRNTYPEVPSCSYFLKSSLNCPSSFSKALPYSCNIAWVISIDELSSGNRTPSCVTHTSFPLMFLSFVAFDLTFLDGISDHDCTALWNHDTLRCILDTRGCPWSLEWLGLDSCALEAFLLELFIPFPFLSHYESLRPSAVSVPVTAASLPPTLFC